MIKVIRVGETRPGPNGTTVSICRARTEVKNWIRVWIWHKHTVIHEWEQFDGQFVCLNCGRIEER